MFRRLFWVSIVAVALGCGGGGEPAESEAAPGEGRVAESAGGEDLPPAPTVSGAEAREMVASGAMLLDVTPPQRAEESFIEGRTNIPLPELRERMDELPRDRPIVVYCFGGRGSPRAGAILQAEGYDVQVMGARSNWDEAGTPEEEPVAEAPE